MSPDERALIEDLSARAAIESTLIAYCRAIDRLDLELLRDCYAEKGTDDRGLFCGSADDLVPYVQEHVGRMEKTMHYLSNVTIEIDDARARSSSYVLAFHRTRSRSARSGLRDHWVGARYLDAWVNEADGRWRIASRKVVWDWTRTSALGRTWQLPDEALLPARDRTDPSYAHLSDHVALRGA